MLRPTQVPNFQDMTDKYDMIYSFISLGLLSRIIVVFAIPVISMPRPVFFLDILML
jgi:hypothetical protein